jgi:hypothetical protein
LAEEMKNRKSRFQLVAQELVNLWQKLNFPTSAMTATHLLLFYDKVTDRGGEIECNYTIPSSRNTDGNGMRGAGYERSFSMAEAPSNENCDGMRE